LFILMIAGCAGVLPVHGGPVHDFGCLFSTGESDDKGISGWSGVGPVLEHVEGQSREFDAMRPFYTQETDERGRTVLDILWPVGTVRTWGKKTDWRFLTAFGGDADRYDPASAYHAWFLPLVFFGRTKAGEDYGAVFPLGGKLGEFMGRDEMSFVLFPLYAHSRLNDLETDHVLWPLISRTTGTGVYQARFFPFYGYSSRSNAWERSYVMWPVWNHVREKRPGSEGSGYMVFPLFGHVNFKDQETWMVLPPLFRHTRTKDGTEGACPWPIVQWRKGPSSKFYMWPIYGRRATEGDRVSFWAWPLVWKGVTESGKDRQDRFRVFPLYAQESRRVIKASATNVTERYVSVWPVMAYEREGSNTEVRVLDLWPFRDTRPVERNLTPWWTLFSRQRNAEGTQGRVLWGLARWKTRNDGDAYRSIFPLVSWKANGRTDAYREWDMLKGLIGYHRDPEARTLQFLYFLHWRIAP
jgi:hypothetical protein